MGLFKYSSAPMKSSQMPMKVSALTVTREGTIRGRIIRRNKEYPLQPSMEAALSNS